MSVMLNELLSAPDVVRNVMAANKQVIKEVAKVFKERGITNITTVARGTSDNAATYFKYIVEAIGEVMVSKFTPSITTVYGAEVNLSKNMVLAISQSGMSTDTLMVVESAKKTGALTVAVTNNCESPLAKKADYHIDLASGEEISVGATKTFLAELAAMFLLSNALSSVSAKMNPAELPPLLSDFIADYKDKIKEFAEDTQKINNFIILTRGLPQCAANCRGRNDRRVARSRFGVYRGIYQHGDASCAARREHHFVYGYKRNKVYVIEVPGNARKPRHERAFRLFSRDRIVRRVHGGSFGHQSRFPQKPHKGYNYEITLFCVSKKRSRTAPLILFRFTSSVCFSGKAP